jgi:hypothetical protein
MNYLYTLTTHIHKAQPPRKVQIQFPYTENVAQSTHLVLQNEPTWRRISRICVAATLSTGICKGSALTNTGSLSPPRGKFKRTDVAPAVMLIVVDMPSSRRNSGCSALGMLKATCMREHWRRVHEEGCKADSDDAARAGDDVLTSMPLTVLRTSTGMGAPVMGCRKLATMEKEGAVNPGSKNASVTESACACPMTPRVGKKLSITGTGGGRMVKLKSPARSTPLLARYTRNGSVVRTAVAVVLMRNVAVVDVKDEDNIADAVKGSEPSNVAKTFVLSVKVLIRGKFESDTVMSWFDELSPISNGNTLRRKIQIKCNKFHNSFTPERRNYMCKQIMGQITASNFDGYVIFLQTNLTQACRQGEEVGFKKPDDYVQLEDCLHVSKVAG